MKELERLLAEANEKASRLEKAHAAQATQNKGQYDQVMRLEVLSLSAPSPRLPKMQEIISEGKLLLHDLEMMTTNRALLCAHAQTSER